MAADIWTLNLQCEGAAHGQQYVQRKMAKDEICFFNLVALIEEYGYTSIDYIYYKSRERLVFIQLDTDVMKMLRDNESKKEVNLLVTSQCIATMAGTKSNKAPTSAANRTKGKRGTKKKQQLNVIETKAQYANDEVNQQHDYDIPETPVAKRNGTVLTHVWGLPEEKRILVKCNQLGQPIGKEGGLLGQFLGTIARNGGYCPIHVKDWRLVKKDSAKTILECIQTKFLYPHSCEKWILKSIGRDWRKYKSTLKKKLFSPKKKRAALYKLCPDDIDEDQWKALVKYWKSAEGKAARLTTYGDFQIDQANIQNHVLQSNRKRIQCPEPNHGDAAYQQRDELNNRTCECDDNDDPVLSNKKCQGDANLKELSLREGEPSSPQCSTNDFTQKQFDVCTQISNDGTVTRKRKNQQVLKETRTKKKHVAHDNATGYNHSKYTQSHPIKDGTTVLLKTASRQNSLVAYATIVSSRPKATVGGVEIGKQFYKVRINHPILQNEPLIRPMADCSKIGDAHAKGTLIAWPSTCVEMING
ncbi:unnamed protein product [Urochloa decumbens]|uniref:Transposase Tnp1/En/Spm-like domain-containing protein n=1 Tax=Urochloa decumbens TaxID=240449 RepID=A0ABC9F528_9POAL